MTLKFKPGDIGYLEVKVVAIDRVDDELPYLVEATDGHSASWAWVSADTVLPPPTPAEPEVDLSGAWLVDAGLAGVNLAGVNLRDARLDGADLCSTHLAGSDLCGAILIRAIDLEHTNLEGAKYCDHTVFPQCHTGPFLPQHPEAPDGMVRIADCHHGCGTRR